MIEALLFVCGWLCNMSIFALLDDKLSILDILMAALAAFMAPILLVLSGLLILDKVVWRKKC